MDEFEPQPNARIRFRFGEVLPADDPLAQWVTTLSRALNDILLARRRLQRGYADDTPAYEHFYDIRALAMHVWELAKFLQLSERAEAVSTFVVELPEDVVVNHRQAIAAVYSSDEDASRFKRQLASARDQATHYSELDHKLLRGALARLADLYGELVVGKRFGDFVAEFAATVDAQMFFPLEDNEEPFREFADRLHKVAEHLIRFARIGIDRYLQRHEGQLHVQEIGVP